MTPVGAMCLLRWVLVDTQRGGVHVDADHLGHPAEVGVVDEERNRVPPCDRDDHAVNHPSGRDPPPTARSVNPGRSVEVAGGAEPEEVEAQEKPT